MASRLEALSCPLCRGSLDPVPGRHGLVWVCRTCRAGAATLPVLRQVAPQAFVNGLWQAALHNGRRSRMVCPSCAQPFTEFAGAAVSRLLKVCVRCFWVWLSADAASSLAARAPLALDPPRGRLRLPPPPATPPGAGKARQLLGSLAADVVVRALEPDAG